eukprot:5718281-Prymnesium_polylepis.1
MNQDPRPKTYHGTPRPDSHPLHTRAEYSRTHNVTQVDTNNSQVVYASRATLVYSNKANSGPRPSLARRSSELLQECKPLRRGKLRHIDRLLGAFVRAPARSRASYGSRGCSDGGTSYQQRPGHAKVGHTLRTVHRGGVEVAPLLTVPQALLPRAGLRIERVNMEQAPCVPRDQRVDKGDKSLVVAQHAWRHTRRRSGSGGLEPASRQHLHGEGLLLPEQRAEDGSAVEQ